MKIEQIRALLKNDKIALEERFIKACVLVDKLRKPLGIGQDVELTFYGYFKQGAFGDCNYPVPNRLYVAQRVFWKTWDGVRGLTKEAAQQAYIDLGLKALDDAKAETSPKILSACNEFSEEALHKLAIDKILRTEGKKLSVIDQAKKISKNEDAKTWSEVAKRMSAAAATNGASVGVTLGAGVGPGGVMTFSALGSSAASAAAPAALSAEGAVAPGIALVVSDSASNTSVIAQVEGDKKEKLAI